MDGVLAPGRPVRALGWTVICFLVLPILVIFPISVTDRRFLSLPEHGISFEHYANLFTSPQWLGSIGQSVVIGIVSAALAVTLGTLCAIGCWRLSSRASEIVRSLMLVPIVVPTIVYAIGIYRFWVDLRLLDTYAGVILAHTVTSIPYVVITVSTSLAGFDARLEQAARSLGASMRQTLWRVVLPSILPGVVSGAIFAFIHSWDELVIVLFIASRAIFTLPRRIWDGINEHLDPTMAAVASILILLSVLLLLLDMTVRRRREG
ncbi:putative spermidine/putrescine transport system permease protein [Enhydrobacter aerosaccus]|uniref:Putative spermidine/putrescine transport system permease protein n=1 Tax=Enhydrobacter aerosaccus TaxID=225324 RepID=A0A1T4SS33_9HYPH|nr:ABC transporter permease [Enhydrobacter aerosaccus]SKA30691.1 putative spermidine/putrescine transport system permease protein [Enhydrobacter aerosaccus]